MNASFEFFVAIDCTIEDGSDITVCADEIKAEIRKFLTNKYEGVSVFTTFAGTQLGEIQTCVLCKKAQ